MINHRRTLLAPAVAALVLAGAVAVAGCGSTGGNAAGNNATKATVSAAPVAAGTTKPAPQTFTLTEHDTSTAYTPNGTTKTEAAPTGPPQPGDRLVVEGQLLRGTQIVGTLHYTDLFEVNNHVQIDGALVLPDGQLAVDGLVALVEPTVIPIVSGTATYQGLTGQLSAAGTSANNATLTITLR